MSTPNICYFDPATIENGGSGDGVPILCWTGSLTYNQLTANSVTQELSLFDIPSGYRFVTICADMTVPFNLAVTALAPGGPLAGAPLLDDATISWDHSQPLRAYYAVVIDSVGTTDTFSWGVAPGVYGPFMPMAIGLPVTTGSPVTLGQGVQVTFGAATGHTLGDSWTAKRTLSSSLVEGVPSFQFGSLVPGTKAFNGSSNLFTAVLSLIDGFGSSGGLGGSSTLDATVGTLGCSIGVLASTEAIETNAGPWGDGATPNFTSGQINLWIFYQQLPSLPS